jgi:ankyrin repeat protein
VRLLLENGADINDRNAEGCTAVMYAAQCNHIQVLGVLLAKVNVSLDINVVGNDGQTAIMTAALAGFIEAVQLILDSGRKIDFSTPIPIRSA